jgi:hypothetical protein
MAHLRRKRLVALDRRAAIRRRLCHRADLRVCERWVESAGGDQPADRQTARERAGVQRIESEISNSDAALVFIGDKWLEPAPGFDKGRIWDAKDFVRAELRVALARPILVLPVLVAGTRMPKPEQLPEGVRAVALKNALPLRHESFDGDTESIVGAVLGLSAKERAWDDKGSLRRKIGYGVGGAVAGSLLSSPSPSCTIRFWRDRCPSRSVPRSRYC